MHDKSSPPLRSPQLLKVAIEATEELLKKLEEVEETPQVIADRKFYRERLALLKTWLSGISDSDTKPLKP